MSNSPLPAEENPLDLASALEARESPRHGFQGDRGSVPERPTVPGGVTIAISRETGARGSSIARRVGQKLGWQVYSQEVLEYMAQESNNQPSLFEGQSPVESDWVDQRIEQLLREQNLSQHPSVRTIAQVVLALGAHGKVVLVGRGAGLILPRASTLHVRIVAPLAERVAFIGQLFRLTLEEAAEHVRQHDQRRHAFVSTHFHCDPTDVHRYDLVLNSGLLGEDLCADLITQAARARQTRYARE